MTSSAAIPLVLLALMQSLILLANPVDCSSSIMLPVQSPDVSTLLTHCDSMQSGIPSPNSYACYRTVTTIQGGRYKNCTASLVKEGEVSTVSRNDNYTIMMVHTPGRLHNRDYVNRLLCQWDVRCPGNQLMYFDLAEHRIEPKRKSSYFREEVCVDFLKIYRENGMEMSCGDGAMKDHTYLEPNNLRVEFRSNNQLRYPGFKLRVACFNPDLQDIEGCSPSNDQIAVRKRRSLRTARNLSTGRRQPSKHTLLHQSHRIRRTTQVQQVAVNHDSTVLYGSSNLQIKGLGGAVMFSVQDINTFHTYTSLEGLVSYHGSQRRELVLRGGGMLTVQKNSGVAYYYMYGVDPKFEPSEEEKELINTLLEAEEVLVKNKDFVIDEEEEGTAPSSTDSPTEDQDMFATDVIAMATEGANSCNAVVRAVATSILDLNQ